MPARWLSLLGTTGTGKTHLAKIVMRQFIDQNRFDAPFDSGYNVKYGNRGTWINWRTFCASIRSGAYDLIEDVCKDWFVILDDVGSERDSTGFIAEAIDRIFNQRQNKWTMITSNLTLQDFANKVDVRVSDRMLRGNNEIIEIDCLSYAER